MKAILSKAQLLHLAMHPQRSARVTSNANVPLILPSPSADNINASLVTSSPHHQYHKDHQTLTLTLAMEGSGHEAKESETTSSEQQLPADQDAAGSGGGRSFDCTFCKRGFSNAQALGGHMNIHRKQRARVRPPESFPLPPPSFSPPQQKSYKVYLPESASAGAARSPKRIDGDRPRVPGGARREEEEEGELNLELRLGH